jgi:ribosomal protein S18 acetylase RimI-like enzyme
MEFEIRPLTLSDYDPVYALWATCEGIGLSAADSRPEIDRFLRRNPGLAFAAWSGPQLAGAVLTGEDGRRGYLYHLAVSPQHRRQGIGRALVQRCVFGLKERGIQKCHIFVYADNQAGIAFWSQLGFELRPELVILSREILPAPVSRI